MSYLTRPLLSAACALLLLGPAVQAQDVPKPAAPAPAPPAAGAEPNAAAQTLLGQIIAAQKAVTALSATLAVTSKGGSGDENQTITLAFKNASGAKAVIADNTGPLARIISNGKTLTTYDVRTKQYLAQSVPAGMTAVRAVFSASRAILPRMLSRPEGLAENLNGHGIHSELSTGTVGATPVDVITFHFPIEAGQPHLTLMLAAGHDDHLLRKLGETISMTQAGKVQTFMHTETISSLNLAPTLSAADFTFTPPPGAKKAPPQAAEPPMYDPRLKRGARPFAFTAKDLSGKPLSLSQYKGKVVLMDFWATWCGPCVAEMPNVIAAYKKYHARGFDIVGISLDQDKPSLTSFIAQNKMPWRQVFDGKGWGSAVPKRYGVQAIPFGLLLNRDGTIAAVSVRGDALPAAIKVALAKK